MVKLLDKWCDIYWLVFISVVSVITACCLFLNWDEWVIGTKAAMMVAIIMAPHCLEEWKFPGGFHYMYNTAFGPKDGSNPDMSRYPMSRFTDMLNVIGMQWVPLAMIPLCVHRGLSKEVTVCMFLFSFLETVAHTGEGIFMYRRFRKVGKRTIYSPGLVTCYVLFLPASIYMMIQIWPLTATQWIIGILLFVLDLFITHLAYRSPFQTVGAAPGTRRICL